MLENTVEHHQIDLSRKTAIKTQPAPDDHFDLPPRDTVRWVSSRKAAVVAAVRIGVITLADACSRYSLSMEEFASWQRAVERHGNAGLRITHVQEYRKTRK